MNNNDRSNVQEVIAEYAALYQTALSWVAGDDEITDKARCARSMVEAHYRGRLDREMLDAAREAVVA